MLPTPIRDQLLVGMIGRVWKKLDQKVCTFPQILSPSLLALIAANTIIHISPIAKKLINIQENRSNASPRLSLVNSNSKSPKTLIVSVFSVDSIGSICIASWKASELHEEENPLMSADIKIKERLSAATVITGAKTIPMTLLILR